VQCCVCKLRVWQEAECREEVCSEVAVGARWPELRGLAGPGTVVDEEEGTRPRHVNNVVVRKEGRLMNFDKPTQQLSPLVRLEECGAAIESCHLEVRNDKQLDC
jgi:hypothetical protein